MTAPLNIVIAGGGIGGLTTALALAADGHKVTVCEATPELKPLGVGINVLPHAVAVLDSVGMLDTLDAMAVRTHALVFANRHGQTIYEDLRGKEVGYSHSQYSVHRGYLQLALWDRATQVLGEENMHLGQRAVSCSQDDSGVTVLLETPDGQRSERRCDLLIAADGIHSAIRKQFYPDEGVPRWNGMMMWRGTTWAKPYLNGRTMVQAGHRRAKFVVYPISAPREDGLQLINWICDRRLREDGFGGGLTAPNREDWSRAGKLEDLMPTFESWSFEWLDVPGMIQNAEQLFEWPMVDRDPLPRWQHGRVTLLGDAAHPMYPIGSNGATQAILDARAIADALRENADVETALQVYESGRRPMTTKIVEMNRQEGLDFILDMVEEKSPEGFQNIETVLDPQVLKDWVGEYKRAAGHRQQASTAEAA